MDDLGGTLFASCFEPGAVQYRSIQIAKLTLARIIAATLILVSVKFSSTRAMQETAHIRL